MCQGPCSRQAFCSQCPEAEGQPPALSQECLPESQSICVVRVGVSAGWPHALQVFLTPASINLHPHSPAGKPSTASHTAPRAAGIRGDRLAGFLPAWSLRSGAGPQSGPGCSGNPSPHSQAGSGTVPTVTATCAQTLLSVPRGKQNPPPLRG